MSPHIHLRRQALEPIPVPEPLEVHLTDKEAQLCDLLDGCRKYLQEEKGISTTCRIAGGWVRDKLLGHDSNDIDIALSDMMGLAFAEHLVSYADAKGVEFGKIAKIAQNPDQSKHLETATLKLAGLDIDLVNLRSEEYTQNSRIPTEISFGTPLQDAKRRDITINALFYNVHTKEVEDYTQRGFDDLRDGLIRTPLPPLETFRDDPLRVLRCIRFATRFGFQLVPEIKNAARDPTIQEALVTKVARERVGTEVNKMVQGRDPLRSIELFHELSLYNPVFFSAIPHEISCTFSQSTFSTAKGLACSLILDGLLNDSGPEILAPHPLLTKHLSIDPSARPRLYLSAALTPFKGVTYMDRKGKVHPAVEAIVRDSMKLGAQNHYVDGIPALFLSIEPVQQLLSDYSTFPHETFRSCLGLGLRNKAIHAPTAGIRWPESVLFSMVVELGDVYDVQADALDADRAISIISKYNDFANQVEHLDIYGVGDAVPLIDGRAIMKTLDIEKGGPWLSDVQHLIMQWQLDHPGATADNCIAWLKGEQTSGRIPVPAPDAQPPTKKLRKS